MPPIPRDNKRAPSAHPSVPEVGDEKQKHNALASGSIHAGEKPPEAVITPIVDAPAMPAPVYLPHSGLVSPIPDGPIIEAARLCPVSVASHSSSPTPSLSGAILRARRPATPHTPGTTQPKGTRFKSSFTGVADHVLRLGEQYQQQVQFQTPGDHDGEDRDVVANKNSATGNGTEMPGEA